MLSDLKRSPVFVSILTACALSFSGVSLFGEYGQTLKHDAPANALSETGTPASSPSPEWSQFDTYYSKVYYRDGVRLETIERRLKQRGFFYGRKSAPNDVSVEVRIGFLLDRLYNRAQDLLDMRPKIVRLKIKIYENRDELNDEYYKIFKSRPDYKSFYIHKYTTIYTSEEDMSDSVIIHEMGHAIVDHYFAVIPPPTVGEILASYVDMHLTD